MKTDAEQPIRVFVHLARALGGDTWNRLWREGKIFGINEQFPYGYHRAMEMGCSVTYSQDHPESKFMKLFRLGVRAALGFDFVHAYRNFALMQEADVIWTHTESQFLSILLLFRFKSMARRPKLIAQSVWLFDQWDQFSVVRRYLLAQLIRDADVLTVHSPDNLAVVRRVFPQVRSELVLFGISADAKLPPKLRSPKDSLNLVSLGNDRDRDWELLIDAIRNQPNCRLKIASRTLPASIADAENVEIVVPKTNEELLALYRWADLLVVTVKPNLHASGITVVQEGVLQGVPVICTDTGGLRAYFSRSEVYFVEPQNVAALRRAISVMVKKPEIRLAYAKKAQDRMGPRGLSSESFVRRHVEISRELLAVEAGFECSTRTI